MRKWYWVLVAIPLYFFWNHSAFADEPSIEAPVCYQWTASELNNNPILKLLNQQLEPSPISCESDITLSQAKSSHSGRSQIGNACTRTALTPAQATQCGSSYLMAATEYNLCDWDVSRGHQYLWAPKRDFVDGDYEFKFLLQHAKSGEVFNDEEIVEANSSTRNEQHLALCQVETVLDIHGPPEACTTVAIITPTETWMRGRVIYPGQSPDLQLCPMSASFRPDGAIDIKWKIMTARNPEGFAEAMLKMLMNNLGLTAEMHAETDSSGTVEEVDLTSVTGIRNSTILPTWREALDFDLEISSSGNGPKVTEVDVDGVVHALVSRQALGSLSQYQGLDDAQQDIYSEALDAKTVAAIESVCQEFKKLDSSTVSCR